MYGPLMIPYLIMEKCPYRNSLCRGPCTYQRTYNPAPGHMSTAL